MSAIPRANAPSVVVLGLDMGDGELIQQWSRSGALPNLQALMAEGTWVDLDSTAEILHTSTWPTFATGTLPGRHGVYYPLQPKSGEQKAQHVAPQYYGARTFWSIADRGGKRCLVYDVPETFPEPGFGGRAIFEWGTWAWYGEPASHPAGLRTDLETQFGKYPLGMEAMRLGLARPSQSLLDDKLPKSVEHKRASLDWLMRKEPWDLVVAGFCETHPAGHYFWPDGVLKPSGADDPRFRQMKAVYVAIDRAIGQLRDSLPPTTTLLIVSGDGVRVNHAGWHLLPTVLERFGYQNAPTPGGAHIEGAQINWAGTRAFTLPTDLEGCIRINLKGREPQGIVEPADYAALCAEIRDRMLTLINPATGRSAVRKVWQVSEVFPGARLDQLPDIVVSWNDEAPLAALEAPGMERVALGSPDPRTGTHSTTGFLLGCGPGVSANARVHGHLVQVAPTILKILGISADAELDGTPLPLWNPAPVAGSRAFPATGG
jgi:predicted AlkP superfamily phosphohydrolase/phosphomutase